MTGSSEGAIPAGNISGLKMMSVAALSSSASTRSSVNVPASTCSRSAGQPLFKCLHLGGIGLSGRGILLECKQALVEDLRCADREQREVDHRSTPQFAVG